MDLSTPMELQTRLSEVPTFLVVEGAGRQIYLQKNNLLETLVPVSVLLVDSALCFGVQSRGSILFKHFLP